MLFMKNPLHMGKKKNVARKNSGESVEKKTNDARTSVPVRKVSDREIAMGYMLW